MGVQAGWPVRATCVPLVAGFLPIRQNALKMEQQTVRKTYKYKLNPTPAQEQALETALLRCRTLYNIALEQRRTW